MKKLILTILLSVFVLTIFSKPVTVETAKQVARNFYFERAKVANIQINSEIKPILYLKRELDLKTYYFIFNIEPTGYIIITGDDELYPVLGYSFESEFDSSNIPPAIEFLMNEYIDQIQSYYSSVVYRSSNSSKNTDEWNFYNSNNFNPRTIYRSVNPLISTKWDQNCYYNLYFPQDPNGVYCGRCPTGCVNTAMAQIINYHKYPKIGFGSRTENSNYGPVTADFSTAIYDYSKMVDEPSSANNEISKLMYHCSIASNSWYGPTGTSSALVFAMGGLVNFFNYSLNMTDEYKHNRTDSIWESMLINDINNSRPILYGCGNHAVVLDGYQGLNNNHFHFNFGWSGQFNGYYYLSNLGPNGNYTTNQEALFGIEPSYNVNKDFIGCDSLNNFTSFFYDSLSICNYKGDADQHAERFLTEHTGYFKGIKINPYYVSSSSDSSRIIIKVNTELNGVPNQIIDSQIVYLDDLQAGRFNEILFNNCKMIPRKFFIVLDFRSLIPKDNFCMQLSIRNPTPSISGPVSISYAINNTWKYLQQNFGQGFGLNIIPLICDSLSLLPLADFSSDNNIISCNNTITFESMSMPVTEFIWTFEGGYPNHYIGKTPPPILYADTGKYDVKLVVKNRLGVDSITKKDFIEVGLKPIAQFNHDTNLIHVNDSVLFIDNSLNANYWVWYFEEGFPDTFIGQNPPYIKYNKVGTFGVKLLVKNKYDSDSVYYSKMINVGSEPIAGCRWEKRSYYVVKRQDSVIFIDTSWYSPTAWQWLFEGGTPSAYFGKQPPPVYYNEMGDFDVKLIVENSFGKDSIIYENQIQVIPLANIEEAEASTIIYPNPTSGSLFIKAMNFRNPYSAELYNINGKLILLSNVLNTSLHQIELRNEPSGLYILKITTDDTVKYYKVVKQ